MNKALSISVWVLTNVLFTQQIFAQKFNKNLQEYSISLEDDFNSIEHRRKEKLK